MNRLYEWAQSRAAKLEQYGHSEINAELLRQEIKELEKESLDPDMKHKIFKNADKIKLLKEQLEEVQSFADLSAQSRNVGRECLRLGQYVMETKEFPPGADDVLDRYMALMDTIDKKEKAIHRAQRFQLSRCWPRCSWTLRSELLQWYWRTSTSRFFRGTIPRKIARVGVKMLRNLH